MVTLYSQTFGTSAAVLNVVQFHVNRNDERMQRTAHEQQTGKTFFELLL
jgi:hypothetical protein